MRRNARASDGACERLGRQLDGRGIQHGEQSDDPRAVRMRRTEPEQHRVRGVRLGDVGRPCLPLLVEEPQVMDVIDQFTARASSSGPHAGDPARLSSMVTSTSRRLKAPYRTGRYAICSATMVRPAAAAQKMMSRGATPGSGGEPEREDRRSAHRQRVHEAAAWHERPEHQREPDEQRRQPRREDHDQIERSLQREKPVARLVRLESMGDPREQSGSSPVPRTAGSSTTRVAAAPAT